MPTYSAPRSDSDRLATLDSILTATDKDPGLAALLPADLRPKIVTFVAAYRPLVAAVDTSRAGRTKEVAEKDNAKDNLETHARDFCEVLNRRTSRLKHNVAVLVHYGLPQSGDVPSLTSEDDLTKFATELVAGEKTAVAAGFPAMANPSAAELDVALKAYQKESSEVAPADEKLRAAQTAAANQRSAADDLISDVKDEVSHALRKQDAPSIRRVLRQLGFVFTANPGETPEAPPPVTPPAK